MFFAVDITDKEFKNLSNLIYEKSGINLGDHKKELLKNRLRKRLVKLELSSFKDYFRYLTERDTGGEEMSHMLTAISTNVTYFFREDAHFKFLEEKALPVISKKKNSSRDRKLRVWCAGCSSGEEPYSIAITINDYLKSETSWDIKILSTDISSNVLRLAKDAVYKEKSLKNINSMRRSNYFNSAGTSGGEALYAVKEYLKSMVYIRHLNLQDEAFPFKGPFDFIFCRNVLIYFDKKTQERLVSRFHQYLSKGGYLFLGHTEGLAGRHAGFKQMAPAVYIKL